MKIRTIYADEVKDWLFCEGCGAKLDAEVKTRYDHRTGKSFQITTSMRCSNLWRADEKHTLIAVEE